MKYKVISKFVFADREDNLIMEYKIYISMKLNVTCSIIIRRNSLFFLFFLICFAERITIIINTIVFGQNIQN